MTVCFSRTLHAALPLLSILALGRFAPRRGVLWVIVAGVAFYHSLLAASSLVLGHLGLLQPAPFRVALGAAAVALLGSALTGLRPLARTLRALRFRVALADGFLAGAVVLAGAVFALQAAQDWIVGTRVFDALSYHIPRALIWSWHGSFEPWRAGVWQQVGLPVAGDASLQPGIFLGLGWLGAGWTSSVLAVGAAAAIAALARSLGWGRRPALVAALAFFSFPTIGLRLVDVSTDIAAAFPILAGVALLARAPSLAEGMFLFPALCGLGAACKPSVAFVPVVLAAALLPLRLRALLRDRRAWLSLAGGTLVAALFCAGSYVPVYRLFGDLYGGGEGRSLNALSNGAPGVARSASFGLLHWLLDPFAIVPEPERSDILDRVGVGAAYRMLGAGTRERWYPAFDPETNRSGVFPLLALPWLIAALPRGQRLAGGGLFLAVVMAQFAPLRLNCYDSRYSVVALAAFALLWGARARLSPMLSMALLLTALSIDGWIAERRAMAFLGERHHPEPNANVAAAVGDETLLIVTVGLSVDAVHAGRRAQVRFEYVSCPPDEDWAALFAAAAMQSSWLMLSTNSDRLTPGPSYPSRLGAPCRNRPVSELVRALGDAGWTKQLEERGYQLWRAPPEKTSHDESVSTASRSEQISQSSLRSHSKTLN